MRRALRNGPCETETETGLAKRDETERSLGIPLDRESLR